MGVFDKNQQNPDEEQSGQTQPTEGDQPDQETPETETGTGTETESGTTETNR